MTTSHKEVGELLERVRASREADNALDIEIDIALFEPDERYVSVSPNSANTKLVYTLMDGRTETYWARDHTLNADTRSEATRLLLALSSKEPS